MSERKICPHCNSANKVNAKKCAICREEFETGNLDTEQKIQQLQL